MTDQPSSRQELYDRIRRSSKDEVILEEMIRLGFWPAEGNLPQDPADEIRRRGELERALRALRTEQSRLLNEAAHGFRTGHSIMTNALPHVGREIVINIDLKDFFPTVSYARVKGLFRSFGYSEAVATVFGLLCTEPDIESVEAEGRLWHIALSDRHLPQGAPSSPAITNCICREMDRILTLEAERLGFIYPRYADDLTNRRPNIDRRTLKRFRALLHQIEHDGLEGKQWGASKDLLASIRGFANYVYMVNPYKGEALRAQVRRIVARHGAPTSGATSSGERPPERPLPSDSPVSRTTKPNLPPPTLVSSENVPPPSEKNVDTPFDAHSSTGSEAPPEGQSGQDWWKDWWEVVAGDLT